MNAQAPSTGPVEVHAWMDVACPWCWIAKRRLPVHGAKRPAVLVDALRRAAASAKGGQAEARSISHPSSDPSVLTRTVWRT